MENRKIWFCSREESRHRSRRQERGFALVSLLSTLPLLIAVVGVLATTFMALKRKSLAQALCVQNGMHLQVALKKPLKKLLQLNSKATSLRAARTKADHALEVATASGNPPAIAAAKAARDAVILQQLALQTSQRLLLNEAQALRFASSRELDGKLHPLAASPVHSQTYFSRALAVRPNPEVSLTPNYETIPMFTAGQQQRFSFDVDLLGEMPFANKLKGKQKTECSVSLKESDQQWKIQIVTAKAPSNSL